MVNPKLGSSVICLVKSPAGKSLQGNILPGLTTMRKLTYQLSGNFEPMGVILGCLAGLAAGLPLAFVYAWGIIQIDEQRLAVIATITYGAALGLAPAFAMKWGKVRNVKIAGGIALGTAVVSYYCSWAFWVSNVFKTFKQEDIDSFRLMQKSQAMWDIIKMINQYGTWGSSKDSPTTGTELWLIWLGEAVVVLLIATVIAREIIKSHPFCEACKLWCSASEKLVLSAGDDPTPLRRAVDMGDFSFLQKLGPGNAKGTHLHAHLHSCPSCGALNTLTLRHTYIKPAKFGKPKVSHTTLGTKLVITRQEADLVRSTAQSHKQMAMAAKA
jgi:hypothetical protein